MLALWLGMPDDSEMSTGTHEDEFSALRQTLTPY